MEQLLASNRLRRQKHLSKHFSTYTHCTLLLSLTRFHPVFATFPFFTNFEMMTTRGEERRYAVPIMQVMRYNVRRVEETCSRARWLRWDMCHLSWTLSPTQSDNKLNGKLFFRRCFPSHVLEIYIIEEDSKSGQDINIKKRGWGAEIFASGK